MAHQSLTQKQGSSMPSDRYFDSESAWPGFDSLGNYFPKTDIAGLNLLLNAKSCTGTERKSRYLEVGSFVGTTAKLAADAGFKQITCIDTWEGGSDPNDWINGLYQREGDRVYETFKANTAGLPVTAIRTTSFDAATTFGNESQDVIFLDADHSYEAVKQDIEAWYPKVRPGGVLCGHDYNPDTYPGVKRAVHEMFRGWDIFVYDTVWMVFVKDKTAPVSFSRPIGARNFR